MNLKLYFLNDNCYYLSLERFYREVYLVQNLNEQIFAMKIELEKFFTHNFFKIEFDVPNSLKQVLYSQKNHCMLV